MTCHYAASHSEKKVIAAVLKQIACVPEKAHKIRQLLENPKPSVIKLTPE